MISRLQRVTSLFDPCFLFRPDVFGQACVRKLRKRPDNYLVKTSWGDAFAVDPRKFIGAHLYMRGVHELPVCEALWRLADAGETVADIGANIGVMTSVLSRRVGTLGRVIAFEPHPLIARSLRNNAKRWSRNNVQVVEAAVSKASGFLTLRESGDCETNEGTAQIRSKDPQSVSGRCFEVRAVALDREFKGTKVSVIKIDVEGHELAVLEGATGLLKQGAIRDIVFESTYHYPNAFHRLLLSCGYSVFRIGHGFWGPQLIDPVKLGKGVNLLADYVATTEPNRARKRFAHLGWKALSGQP